MAIALNHKYDVRRRGIASLLVLVIIATLSMAVFAFANHSYLAHSATRTNFRQTQSRLLALSGLEAIKHHLTGNQSQPDQLLDSVPVLHNLFPKDLWQQYGVDVARSLSRNSIRPGLQSESAKLNLNALDLSKNAEQISRARLTALPGVTPNMADALLDWLDADDTPRAFGVESAWYTENAAELPANRPLRNLFELTHVRGFDAGIVFGEDTNGNRWLDWNEDDGRLQAPDDNADQLLNRGLSGLVTVHAFESNVRRTGGEKIFVNDQDLGRLYTRLEEVFGGEAATFVVAYRLDGPLVAAKRLAPGELKRSLDETFEARLESQLDDGNDTAATLTKIGQTSSSKGRFGSGRSPVHRIRSLIDLVDVTVVTVIEGEEKMLDSPWQLASADPHQLLRDLEDQMTVDEGPRSFGRIDLRQAEADVLLTIPGFDVDMAMTVVNARKIASIPSVYWLVQQGVCDLELLRKLGPYVTTQAAIYSGYSIGHDWVSQSSAIMQFTLSHEGDVVRLLERTEIGFVPQVGQGRQHASQQFPK